MSLIESIAQIIGYAVLVFSPTIVKEVKAFLKDKGDYFSKNLKVRRQIDEVVNETRIHMEGCRAYLMEFSNTEKSTGGFPFEFASITHEKLDGNVVPIKDRFQKVHIGALLEWLAPIEGETQRFFIYQNDDEQLPESVRFKMRELSISTCIYYKVSDRLKNGVLVLHFTHPYMEDWAESELVKTHYDNTYLRFHCNRIFQLMRSLKK
jgi:hypothetical protein